MVQVNNSLQIRYFGRNHRNINHR